MGVINKTMQSTKTRRKFYQTKTDSSMENQLYGMPSTSFKAARMSTEFIPPTPQIMHRPLQPMGSFASNQSGKTFTRQNTLQMRRDA